MHSLQRRSEFNCCGFWSGQSPIGNLKLRLPMDNVRSTLKFLLTNFGPLIVFYLSNHFFGLKEAIGISVAFTIGEVIYQKVKNEPISAFFIFSAVMSIVFGTIDLYLPHAVFFNYEAAFTNVITGIFFVIGAFGKKPLIQELAEKRRKFDRPEAPDLIYFFRIFTLIWATYFFIKATLYVWLAGMPISTEEKMAIRGTAGGASLYAMLALSIFGGRKLFYLFKKMGWLPPVA